jgi:3-phosphoglycerate kinase
MIIRKKTIKDIKNLKGKRVFLTVDFNISLTDGKVTNDTRIVAAIPTIRYLLEKGATVILASHLGRPKGYDPKFSLRPVADRLSKHMGIKVNLIEKFWEDTGPIKISKVKQGELTLLDNIRFYKGEKDNDPIFSKHLADMADYFVNDAFGTAHRVHASTVGITRHLPSFAGLLMAKEIDVLSGLLHKPKKPFVVFIGGAKTPEKIAVIEKLLDIADTIALGGAIANTFLAAWGFGMGTSLVDYEMVEMARVVFWNTSRKHSALLLPVDVVTANQNKNIPSKEVPYNRVPQNVSIFDIGSKTRKIYADLIKNAATIVWNGPMGYYEDKKYKKGTDFLLHSISESKAFSVIGGGDTLTSIKTKSFMDKISHVSTGGSAMLAFLEKGNLPGIQALLDKK